MSVQSIETGALGLAAFVVAADDEGPPDVILAQARRFLQGKFGSRVGPADELVAEFRDFLNLGRA